MTDRAHYLIFKYPRSNMSDYYMSETVPACPNNDCYRYDEIDQVQSHTGRGDDDQWICSTCSTQFTGPTFRSTWDDPNASESEYEPDEWTEEESEYVPESPIIQPPPSEVFLRSQNRLANLPLALPVSNANVANIPPLAVEVPVAHPIEPDAQPEQDIDLDPMTAPIDQLRVMYPGFFNPIEVIDLTDQ